MWPEKVVIRVVLSLADVSYRAALINEAILFISDSGAAPVGYLY